MFNDYREEIAVDKAVDTLAKSIRKHVRFEELGANEFCVYFDNKFVDIRIWKSRGVWLVTDSRFTSDFTFDPGFDKFDLREAKQAVVSMIAESLL